ncbi:MAG: hypothetical protein QXG60_06640 [Thermoplasmata archaeon]
MDPRRAKIRELRRRLHSIRAIPRSSSFDRDSLSQNARKNEISIS